MRVLMISLDKGLVGGKILGDVIERHKKYGEFVDALDIIVLSPTGFKYREISEQVRAQPTNSFFWVLTYVHDALRIANGWLKIRKYDLIIAQDPYFSGRVGLALKKAFRTKLLVHLHGDYSVNFLTRKVLSNADAIRVMSEGQKTKLVDEEVHPDKIRVISTPIDISRFINYPSTPEEEKQLRNLSNQLGNRRMILWVARKDKVKDRQTLERAMSIVIGKKGKDQTGLWIVGDYQKQDFESDLVSFESGRERVTSKDIPANYKASYLTVSTSKSESFGKVLVEANACGRPVVATDTTGSREIVQHGYNGYIVPIGDYQGLADKILYLIDHPDLAKKMGENGRKLAIEKFSDNTKRIINFWRDVVGVE